MFAKCQNEIHSMKPQSFVLVKFNRVSKMLFEILTMSKKTLQNDALKTKTQTAKTLNEFFVASFAKTARGNHFV